MTKPRLLSMARASAEVTAGIPGQCAVSIRVLDDVTLRIHAGELLLLQAREALSQSMLLTALAGGNHSPRHRYVRAVRDAVPGLRIRRAALHLDAVPEIVRGWREAILASAVPGAPSTATASSTLYLLRVSRQRSSRDAALTLREAAEWRRWGRQAHERRDGVVITCPPLAIFGGQKRHAPTASSAHEPMATYDARAVVEEPRAVRLLELRAGRLHTVRAPRRYFSDVVDRPTADPEPHRWSVGDSSGARAPTACRRLPTPSPES